MKKILILFLFIAFVSANQVTYAQQKATTEIGSVKQKGDMVRFTLVSSKPFIFGNNRYVLYIGEKKFYRNEQMQQHGKGYLTFLIPGAEFSNLPDGMPVYLSYGYLDAENDDMEELAAKSYKCWSLGKFEQSLLTK